MMEADCRPAVPSRANGNSPAKRNGPAGLILYAKLKPQGHSRFTRKVNAGPDDGNGFTLIVADAETLDVASSGLSHSN
jgi:hypothetical protein